MKHNIHYSAAALQDLDDIWSYVARELQNVSAAERLLNLLIAAHARAAGLTIVTNNTREFDRVDGLTVENWAAP